MLLSDAEIDALATELLSWALNEVSHYAEIPIGIEVSNTGERFPVYNADNQRRGGFSCLFRPLNAVKEIIRTCDKALDLLTVESTNLKTGESKTIDIREHLSDNQQATLIRDMAECATAYLIESTGLRLSEAIEDAVANSGVIAQGVLSSIAVVSLQTSKVEAEVDARMAIEALAKTAADRRRTVLQKDLKDLPEMIVSKGRGAPPKSEAERQHQRTEQETQIRETYRALRLKHGSKPTKTQVAQGLNLGGTNLASGGNSSLNVLNGRLKRLGIDYNSIVSKLEAELNSNS